MRSTPLLPSLLIFCLLGASGCGGGDTGTEKEFHLSEVPADKLSAKGMGKDFTGDTAGLADAGARIPSPDGSKVAWCEANVLYVADAEGGTQQGLHTETEDTTVFACFAPTWGADGKSISFKEARRNPGDSAIQVVTVDITLGHSEEE